MSNSHSQKQRLQAVLGVIEQRMDELSKRPTLEEFAQLKEEFNHLKNERNEDLRAILSLKDEIQNLRNGGNDG